MNRLRKFFYEKDKAKMLQELQEYGLQIIDEDKFHRHVMQTSKKNMMYTVLFILLIIAIIWKWVYGG